MGGVDAEVVDEKELKDDGERQEGVGGVRMEGRGDPGGEQEGEEQRQEDVDEC